MNMKKGEYPDNELQKYNGVDHEDVNDNFNDEMVGDDEVDTKKLQQTIDDATLNYEEDDVRDPKTGRVWFYKSDLKIHVAAYKRKQKERVAKGNQIFAAYMKSLGIKPGLPIYEFGELRQLMSHAYSIESESNIKKYKLDGWTNEEFEKYDLLKKTNVKEAEKLVDKRNVAISQYIVDNLKKEYEIVTKLLVESFAPTKKMAEEYAKINDINELRRIISKKQQLTVMRKFNLLLTRKGNELQINYLKVFPLYQYIDSYMNDWAEEKRLEAKFKPIVHYYKLWDMLLQHFCGVGETTAAILLSKVNIKKVDYIPRLWKYAGYDTVMNPETGIIEGRSRKKFCRETKVYEKLCTDKIQKEIDKKKDTTNDGGKNTITTGITFNPDLKTALYLMNVSLVKVKEKSPYYDVMVGYKTRLQNEVDMGKRDPKVYTKGHIQMMTFRYISKMFLQDVWVHWRLMYKMSIKAPYPDFYLKHESHIRTIDLETGNVVLIDWHDVPNPKYLCGKLYQELPDDKKDDSQFNIEYGPLV